MSSIKTYNPQTGKWEVRGTSQASSVGVMDLSGNFTSDNVEGCLREVGNRISEQDASIYAAVETAITSRQIVETLKNEFDDHLTNHPSGGGSGSDCQITSTFEGGIIDTEQELEIPLYFS